METRSVIRTILAALIGLGILVIVIILIVRIFSGGDSGSTSAPIDLGQYENTSASATLVVEGPTVLDQDRNEVRITVSGTQNTLEVIKGYQGQVVDSRTYASNSNAFGAFLQALKHFNFSSGNSEDKTDYRGFCPDGSRYLYSFNDDSNKELFKYWSTSCGGQGTFEGNAGPVRQLFIRQVDQNDFSELAGSLSLIF